MASTACRVAGGSAGSSRTRRKVPGRACRRECADHPEHSRVGLQSRHVGLDLQRDRAHRQHPAFHAEDAAEFVEGGDRIGQHLGQACQHQVADRVSGQGAVAAESVLQDGRPQLSVRTVRCQGRQGHSQIAWRHDAEFVAQPARRTAVIGDRHHRGDVGGQPPRRGQRCVQAVPTAQGDDALAIRWAHSRPRSRCSTRTDSCSLSPSSCTKASAIATLRCLPPVQPIATVI